MPLIRLAPPLFVLIWATGFVVARLTAPHAEPLLFLCVRYAFSFAAFVVIAWSAGASWPRTRKAWTGAAVSGVLLQAWYLGGVFWSVRHGLPGGIAALLGGLQPLLTAALSAPLLGEIVPLRRWTGIALGLCGAVLVLLPHLAGSGVVSPGGVAICASGVLGLTLGTIWQKHTGGHSDLRANAAIQFLAALIVTAPVSALTESAHFDFSLPLLAGLAWAVLGLSVGAISLLLLLIKRGAVAGVASLFYLVPPVAALLTWALFGETLTPAQLFGMLVAVAGVALASR